MKAPLSLRRKFRDAIRRSYQGAKFPDSIEMSEAILRCRQALLTCVALAISLTIMNAKNLNELRWKNVLFSSRHLRARRSNSADKRHYFACTMWN